MRLADAIDDGLSGTKTGYVVGWSIASSNSWPVSVDDMTAHAEACSDIWLGPPTRPWYDDSTAGRFSVDRSCRIMVSASSSGALRMFSRKSVCSCRRRWRLSTSLLRAVVGVASASSDKYMQGTQDLRQRVHSGRAPSHCDRLSASGIVS